jgi:ribosome biogenesis GTPase
MSEAVIIRSLSGFYTVRCGPKTLECRAKGVFRNLGVSPLVGDRVEVRDIGGGEGLVSAILPRRNAFVRPAVANVDLLVFVASAVPPVTDPFLIDRVAAIAELNRCETVICVNKTDLDPAERLCEIYRSAGFPVVRCSAETGEGVEDLRAVIHGRISACTGNSGVGKSSILNRLVPELCLPTGEVSEKLGRGRHTTRHVELYALGDETYVADTPGFASFEVDLIEPIRCEDLQTAFREFAPYLGKCRFQDCRHLREPDCAVRAALEQGLIAPERYQSYQRLYEIAKSIPEWEKKKL